jgi:hypothetical protein
MPRFARDTSLGADQLCGGAGGKGPGSSIFIAADVPGARLSIPLTSYDYVEEEYFVRGTAAAYTHSPSGPNVLRAKFPYTTRIIVRRPVDPKRFSGVVHFEPIHPTQGYVGHWLVLDRYLMSRLRVTDVMRGATSRAAVKTGPILSYSCYGMNCLRKSFIVVINRRSAISISSTAKSIASSGSAGSCLRMG